MITYIYAGSFVEISRWKVRWEKYMTSADIAQ